MTDTLVIAENDDANTGYRFSWGLAIAGGIAATAVTFFLLTLGSGFGLLLVNPASHSGTSAPTLLTGGAIYFFAAQAFGFAVGGHLAGRLLGPLVESQVQEEFRAAAHGFVAWAVTVLATLVVLALVGLAAMSTGGTAAQLYGAPTGAKTSDATAYLVDVLFRPTGNDATPGARGEAARILDAGLARGEQIAPADHDRLTQLVAAQTGIGRDKAASRIDQLQADVQAKTKRAARIAGYTSLWIAASLLFGAVIAMFAAVIAREEDDREAVR